MGSAQNILATSWH